MRKKLWLVFVIMLLLISYTACTNNTTVVTSSESITDKPVENKNLYPAYKLGKKEKLWGYINEEGKFIIEPQFVYAEDFQANGIARIQKDDMQGLINLKGEKVVDFVYTYISDFTDGYAIANKKWEEYFILDEKGSIIYKTENQINSVKDGIAVFGKKIDEWKYYYGYMDINGNVIVEPKYTYAAEFTDDKALVALEEGKYAVIKKDGTVELEFHSHYFPQMSEEIIVISKNYGDYNVKYGYMKMDGTMLVNQMFYQADSFSNGVAIVQLEEEGTYKYKLMNKEGKFLIEESDISSINSIGNNYFSVSKDSNMYLDYTANMYSKNAIFNWQGKQLTDYNYYNANSISEELISVCDDMSTFVINSKGELVKEYPKLNGIGSISSIGEIMKAELDRGLVYFNKGGKIIWQWDNIIDLGDGITAEHHNYRADRFMYICYPEIKGLGNEQIQKEINEQIEDIFIGDNPKSEEDNGEQDAYIEDTTINYLIEKNKDIIILLKSDSYYPLGAAHGSGYLTYYHLNINNGRTYKLSDLFKKDSNYTGVLRDIINKKIAEENQEELAFYDNVIEIGENQGFTVNKDYLEIYFQQYEIAPYAAGFPSFEIPYGDIIDIIDTEGEFWNSFEKSITVSEVNVSEVNEPSIEAKDAITKLLYSYENNLVEAINNNDFELVKPTLLEGSGLYTSQEKLVTNLYSKGIKEKIEDFAVKDIVKGKHSYLVYVEEAIAIQYPEKEFEVKNFDWVYTVVYEKESGEYLLTGIEKWEK